MAIQAAGSWLLGLYRARQAARAARIANQARKGPGLVRQGAGGAALGAGFSLMQGNDLPPQAMGASGMGGRGSSFGAGGGMGGMGGMGGVTAAQATSALQDGDSSNAVVNAIQDLKEVVVSIKGDTATIATGIFGGQGKAEQPPSENAVRGMFGGSGGGGLGAGAAAGAGIGGAMALMMLRNMEFGGEEITDEKAQEDLAKNIESKATEAYEKVRDFLYDTEEGIMENVTSWADTFSSTIRGLTSKIDTIGGSLKSTLIDGPLKAIKGTYNMAADSFKNRRTPTPDLTDAGRVPTPNNVVDINTGKPIDTAVDSVKKVIPEVAASGAGALADNASKLKIAKAIAAGMTKYGAKMVPVVGAGAGAYFAIERLKRGDVVGSIAEGVGVFLPSIIGGLTIDAGLLASDVYNAVYGMDKDGNINHQQYLEDGFRDPEGTAKRYGEIYDMALSAIDELIEKRKNPPFENRQEYLDAMEDLGTRPEKATGSGANRKNRYLKQKQQRWDEEHESIIKRAANTEDITSMFPEFAEMTKNLGSTGDAFTSVDMKEIPQARAFDPEMFEALRQELPLDAYKTLSDVAVTDPNIKTNVMTTEEATLLSQAYQDMLDRVAMMGAVQYAQGIDPSKIGAMQGAATKQAQQEFQQHITRAVERVDYSPYDPQVAGVMLSSAGIEGIRKTFSQ